MARFGLLTLAIAFAGIIGATSLSSAGDAAAPCKRTKFDTKLVKDACAAGGQKQAKEVMKTFLKDAKKKKSGIDCKSCHEKLAPNYELKADGLKLFKEVGGA